MNPQLFEQEDIERALSRYGIPQAKELAKRWHLPLRDAMVEFGITNHLRQAHFLAQLAHESTGFTKLEENLSYSAARLLQIFPRYFTWLSARTYAHRPEAIANRVYDDRNPARINKLGNTLDGDGWRFRGRGLIQTTGRSAYTWLSKALKIDLVKNPDLLLSPGVAARAAGMTWHNKDLEGYADKDDISTITLKINGGLNGLMDRKAWLAVWKQVLKEKE